MTPTNDPAFLEKLYEDGYQVTLTRLPNEHFIFYEVSLTYEDKIVKVYTDSFKQLITIIKQLKQMINV